MIHHESSTTPGPQGSDTPALETGTVAGNLTVHALRRVGTFPSGAVEYARRCGTARHDRHSPYPTPGAAVTCKRCSALLAADADRREKRARQHADRDAALRRMIPDGLSIDVPDVSPAAERAAERDPHPAEIARRVGLIDDAGRLDRDRRIARQHAAEDATMAALRAIAREAIARGLFADPAHVVQDVARWEVGA